jgi:ArsR family transcriptional regulator, virulence genes transcriptional regulator
MGAVGMEQKAEAAAALLSGLASPHRLRILCQLADGEKSVSALIESTGLPQTSMSQHLAKLKAEGLVACRRDHRTLYHSICHPLVLEIMARLQGHFCPPSPTNPNLAKRKRK